MWGALVQQGLQMAGSVVGGVLNMKAAREAINKLEERQRENQNWYDRRYNEDATQRADAQRLLNRTTEAIRERNKEIAGTAAVMGSSEEAQAAAKEQGGKVLADTTSQIAAQADQRKDAIEQQYRERKDTLDDAIAQQKEARRQAMISGLTGGMVNVGNAVAGVTSALPSKNKDNGGGSWDASMKGQNQPMKTSDIKDVLKEQERPDGVLMA